VHPLSPAQALAEKWRRIHAIEAALETGEYSAVKFQLQVLWSMYVTEVMGGSSFPGSPIQDAGLAALVITSFCNDEREMSYQHALVLCEIAAEERTKQQENYARSANETQRCQGAEGPIWDRAAIQLRPLRDRLYTERDQIHRQLLQWRDFCISNHIYPGEGPAAIYAVYGDEKDISVSVLDSPVLSPSDAVLLFTVQEPSNTRRAIAPLAGPLPVCDYPPNSTRAVTIPDIEIEPYHLAIYGGKAIYRGNLKRVNVGTASGANASDEP
jgi:hypothetical protein